MGNKKVIKNNTEISVYGLLDQTYEGAKGVVKEYLPSRAAYRVKLEGKEDDVLIQEMNVFKIQHSAQDKRNYISQLKQLQDLTIALKDKEWFHEVSNELKELEPQEA